MLRAILSENSCGTNDNLSSKAWVVASKLPLMAFFNNFTTQLVPHQDFGPEYHVQICLIVDLMRCIINPQKISAHIDLSNSDSVAHVLLSVLKLCSGEGTSPDLIEGKVSLFYGMQLGAALALGQLCKYDDFKHQSSGLSNCTKATICKLLKRMGMDTLSTNETTSDENSNHGIIDYAINQAYSRDLTRRANYFQSTLFTIGCDVDCIADNVFSNARGRASLLSQLSIQSVRYQEQLEMMNERCEEITRGREKLEQELANKDAFFEQEIRRAKIQSRADAIEHAENTEEEKLKLEQLCATSKMQLSDALNEVRVLRDKSLQQENIYKGKLDNCDEKIHHLESQLKNSQDTINNKIEEIFRKSERVTNLERELQTAHHKFNEEKQNRLQLSLKHDDLKDNNVNVKNKLEDALSKLISITKAYVNLETRSENEQKILREKVEKAQGQQDEVLNKYQRLKEIYHDAEEKIDRLSLQLKKLKTSKSSTSQSSKVDDEANSSKRRQPMGTLAFINSIHDNSMRLDRRDKSMKDNTMTSSHEYTKKPTSKKKTSGFRIVR